MTINLNLSETEMKTAKVSRLISRAECNIATLVGVGKQPNAAKVFGVSQEAINAATQRLEACYRDLEDIHAEFNKMASQSTRDDVQAFIGSKG